MRRALLLAALAAPTLAAAQLQPQAGQVIPTDPPNSDQVHGKFISADECADPNAVVELSWNSGTASASPRYSVYASNTQPTAGTGGAITNCITTDDQSKNIKAGLVGDPLDGKGQTVSFQPYPTAQFVTKAGFTCADTEKQIFVCVQATDSGAVVGVAQVTLLLSTVKPGPPTNLSATPADDDALKISWTAPATNTIAKDYQLEWASDPVDPLDPNPHSKTDITATSYTVSGLAQIPYTFKVWARSEAGSRSATFASITATPTAVTDFWDAYTAAGGREKGGCAAGAAGPVALLAVAGLLAALRWRS